MLDVLGVESRGLLLGGAAAVELGVGFVAVRKVGGLFAGQLISPTSAADYRGRRWELAMQADALTAGDLWSWWTTGSRPAAGPHAVGQLVARLGATLTGISVLVAQAADQVRLAPSTAP